MFQSVEPIRYRADPAPERRSPFGRPRGLTRSRVQRSGVPSLYDLNRLRILQAVAVHGSMNAAASTLNYTRAAVSQQIAHLEREVGTAVVVRHARGTQLTPAGEILVRHADGLLALVAEAELEVAEIVGARRGRMRLGAFGSAVPSLVAGTIATFRARHPGVDVTLVTDEPDPLLRLLRRREIDCAVVFRDTGCPEPHEGLRFRHLLDDSLAVAMPTSLSPGIDGTVELCTLDEVLWIQGPDPHCEKVLRQICVVAGFEPVIPFRTGSYAEALAMVAAGHGVALIPRMVLSGSDPDVAVCDVAPAAPVRRVFATTIDAGFRSAAAQAMVQALAETAKRSVAPTLWRSAAA